MPALQIEADAPQRLVLAWGTVPHAAFPDRVAGAAAAGFDAVGLSIPEYERLRARGWSDAELAATLEHHGVTIDEVEVLYGFWETPGSANLPGRPDLKYADPEAEAIAFHLADTFGVPRVQVVGTLIDEVIDPDRVAWSLADLADRAAGHGLVVALEFVPYSSIPDLRTAAEIVDRTGRDNCGLCVDAWHFFRGTPDLSLLESLDPGAVAMIQINDGTRTPGPEPVRETLHCRELPGTGEFEVVAFLAAMRRAGVTAPISVEIYSDELVKMPTEAAAQAAADATRRVLAMSASREPTTRNAPGRGRQSVGGRHPHNRGEENMEDFRPELTYTSFEPFMGKAKTDLQKRHLELVVHHSKGEVLADLDMVMPTLGKDPQYHEFGVIAGTLEDTGPKGWDEVQANYTEMVANGSYVIESKKNRVVVSDDEIVTEGTFRQILTAEVATKMGHVPADAADADFYVLSARTIVFWEFDEDGQATGEDRYVFNHAIEPLDESELPEGYPAQFRTGKVAGVAQ